MRWEIDYLEREGVVRVTTSGQVTRVRRIAMTTAVMAAAEKHNATKFLIDHRDATPLWSTFDIYDLPDNRRLGITRSYKVAIVFSGTAARGADFGFYEARARNLGVDHRLFRDQEAALDWLTGATP